MNVTALVYESPLQQLKLMLAPACPSKTLHIIEEITITRRFCGHSADPLVTWSAHEWITTKNFRYLPNDNYTAHIFKNLTEPVISLDHLQETDPLDDQEEPYLTAPAIGLLKNIGHVIVLDKKIEIRNEK